MKKFLYTVAIFATFFFAACGNEIDQSAFEKLPAIEKSQLVDSKISVNVLWDATISMQGFTTLAPMNVYRTLPDEIENICSSISTLGNVNFYRFGQNATLIDRNAYRQFASPEIYTELITSMSNAVDISNPNELSIIVTDLFESSADWSLITQKLKDKYFSQHLSCAVIGVKNPFDGKIFDVGLKAESFSYATGGNETRFRPFYLFVLGREDLVKNFVTRFEHFRRQQVIKNEIQYVIFTEHLTDKTETFETLPIKSSENIFESGRFFIDDLRIREFGIDSPSEKSSLTFGFHYKPTLGALLIDRNALLTRLDFYSYDPEKFEWVSDKKTRSDGKFSLTSDPESENYLVTFEFTGEKNLTADRLNFLHASMIPTASSFALPDWVSNWNMQNIDMNPNSFDGTKTVNLLHILDSLMDAEISSSQPSLIDLYFLIEY